MRDIARLSVTELRKSLNGLSQQELVELFIKCCGLSKDVENYLAVRFRGQQVIDQLYERYRKQIEDEFFPARGFGKLRLSEAREAIREFRKICNDRKMTFDLMLFHVEMGVDFTTEYGDIDEKFYNSMESMYREVVKWVNSEEGPELYLEYRDRLFAVVSNTSGVGCGFHDGLKELYYSIKWLEEDEE